MDPEANQTVPMLKWFLTDRRTLSKVFGFSPGRTAPRWGQDEWRLALGHGHVGLFALGCVDASRIPRRTVLSLVEKDEAEVLEKLYLSGVFHLEDFDLPGTTLLHHATFYGAHKVLRLLLAAGLAVDALDDEECTPLHLACLRADRQCAAILLEHGADPKARDVYNKEPAMRGDAIHRDPQLSGAVADSAVNREAALTRLRGLLA